MIPPVLCKTCGLPLDGAHMYQKILESRQVTKGAERGLSPTFASVSPPSDEPIMLDVFDALRIYNPCCRTSMSMSMIFSQLY